MKAKEIVLLLFIIAAGVLFYHAHTGKLDITWDWDDGFFFLYDEFVYEETEELEPPFPERLLITNAHGDIDIQGTDEEKIMVLFEKRIRRKNEEEANKVSEKLRMIIDQGEGQITLTTNRDEFKRKRFETYFTVFLPKSMDIKLKNSYGLVKVSRVKNADILNPHGEIIASNISENLVLENSYDDIEVDEVGSDCQIISRHSKVSVRQVRGITLITHRYGDIILEDLGRAVTVDGSHSEVFGKNLTGPVEIESSYERIDLIDIGPTIIRGNQCPTDIQGAEGKLDIKNRYSRVKLKNISGDVSVEGKDLAVYGAKITADRIGISTSYEDIELVDFTGETLISQSHGSIILTPAPLTHPIEVKGSYAPITFYWPSGMKYPFEAQVKGGDIQWTLAEEPSMRVTNGQSIIQAFSEEQSPLIRLSTSYETIRIEEHQPD